MSKSIHASTISVNFRLEGANRVNDLGERRARTDFSRATSALVSSSGNTTSISFFGHLIFKDYFPRSKYHSPFLAAPRLFKPALFLSEAIIRCA